MSDIPSSPGIPTADTSTSGRVVRATSVLEAFVGALLAVLVGCILYLVLIRTFAIGDAVSAACAVAAVRIARCVTR
jgi:hypothetical protein